jgi:exosortase J
VATEIRSRNGVERLGVRPVSYTLMPQIVVALACLCAAAGVFAVWSTFQSLLGIWQSDALKSVGLAVPFACFALILRDWRNLGWETDGSWWGFVLFAATVLLVFIRDQMLLIVTVNKDWLLQLPPLPLIAVVYAASFVLLFGGRRLLRAAWFPVLLMWAVIPVPQTFSRRIDVPLQHMGALVARNFAHVIGVHLTSSDLKLMFSPTTGMFIAPGCDGLRGSITMGLVAIVIAYYYRFRWYVSLLVVMGGVLLGYVFNFLRLCSMVIYDRISVSYPRLGPHEQLADHIVGACIFVLAVAIFLAAIEKLKRPPTGSESAAAAAVTRQAVPAWPVLSKVAAVLVLAALFGADYLHGGRADALTTAANYPSLPASIGQYRLVGTALDETSENVIVYLWGEYAVPGAAGDPVWMGISPRMSVHDAEVCHIARGEDPIWHGQIEAASPAGVLDLTSVMYNNGATQKLEASTVCDGGVCRQYSETGQHITLVYAHPHKELPMQGNSTRPTPVLLKIEDPDTTTPVAEMEPRLAAELAAFLKQANLVNLTAPYSKQ